MAFRAARELRSRLVAASRFFAAAALLVLVALACGRGSVRPPDSGPAAAREAVLDAAVKAALRPAIVWRSWSAGEDYPREGNDPPPGAQVTVIVRDVLHPDRTLGGMRVEAIQLFDSEHMNAGATATSAGGQWSRGLEATGVAEPPLALGAEARYLVRVSHDSYRPLDVLVEVSRGCKAVLEVYLQPGWVTEVRPPAPRATLTMCR